MFKGVFKIDRWKGKRTEFHKRYFVYDGLGILYFDTLTEARSYITIKSENFKYVYSTSKTIYKKLSECYFDKLIKFRLNDSDNNIVNDCLRDCLDCYKFLSKQFFPQYILQKLKYIYNIFFKIANILKLRVLYNTILSIYNSFFTPYPVYNSSDYRLNKVVQLNNNQNVSKKCLYKSS